MKNKMKNNNMLSLKKELTNSVLTIYSTVKDNREN